MTQYLLRRLLTLPLVMVGASIFVFLIMHLIPGDPAQVIAGVDAPPETVKAIERELGLDRPIAQQYVRYLGQVLQGDLGLSLRSQRPVLDEVMDALSTTLQLTLIAACLTPVIAVPLGVLAAQKRGTFADTGLMIVSMLGTAVPGFALALGLMWTFGLRLGVLPISGLGGPIWSLDGARSMLLPSLTLAASSIAVLSRLTRSAVLEVMGHDYMRVARAKGLNERAVVVRHGLRNALLPILTLFGMQIGYLLGGAVVIETVFAIPGVGRLMVTAIQTRDFPLVQGAILMVSLMFLLMNLLVDMLYAWIDPRIHHA